MKKISLFLLKTAAMIFFGTLYIYFCCLLSENIITFFAALILIPVFIFGCVKFSLIDADYKSFKKKAAYFTAMAVLTVSVMLVIPSILSWVNRLNISSIRHNYLTSLSEIYYKDSDDRIVYADDGDECYILGTKSRGSIAMADYDKKRLTIASPRFHTGIDGDGYLKIYRLRKGIPDPEGVSAVFESRMEGEGGNFIIYSENGESSFVKYIVIRRENGEAFYTPINDYFNKIIEKEL